jgi:hypothetical protein
VDRARHGRLFVGSGNNVGHIICAPVAQAVLHEAGVHSLEHQDGVQSFDVSAWTIEAHLVRATDAVTDRK